MQKSFKGELIGSLVEIVSSKNETLIGIKGKIIDETKNTLIIKQGKKIKKIMKSHVILKIDDKTIEGKNIIKRPEDRIKK
ncbi:ribonuclease P protein subunit [Candidatus Woesearchaeota archaeon]|jgi:ribonuclease P protein subunit POP4|nr:ribonuclease P protein subunit [Candidatus Woesearchaeota archaeon]MBT4321731.1 ribonuclease P protein subunit [Candidatus Woesearchaeota archaeon]MBT4631177.1 ribonuclease P protein subunit [Candidatus Woesearchaeota archaeon]